MGVILASNHPCENLVHCGKVSFKCNKGFRSYRYRWNMIDIPGFMVLFSIQIYQELPWMVLRIFLIYRKICLKRKVLKLTCKINLWKEIFKKFPIRTRLSVFSKSYWDFSRNSNQTHLGAWQRFIPQFRIYLLVLVM